MFEGVFSLQRYNGQEERQALLRFRSEGLTEAFHKFYRSSKIGVFRLHSQTSHLPYPPLVRRTWLAKKKTILPTMKSKRTSRKGNKSNLKQVCLMLFEMLLLIYLLPIAILVILLVKVAGWLVRMVLYWTFRLVRTPFVMLYHILFGNGSNRKRH